LYKKFLTLALIIVATVSLIGCSKNMVVKNVKLYQIENNEIDESIVLSKDSYYLYIVDGETIEKVGLVRIIEIKFDGSFFYDIKCSDEVATIIDGLKDNQILGVK